MAEAYYKENGEIKRAKMAVITKVPTMTNPAAVTDVVLGKEYIDGQGQKQTGDFVPPVDTGANGLYKAILEGTAEGDVYNEEITTLREYALANCSELTSLSLPNVTSIEAYALQNCTNLKSISFPKLKTVGREWIANCSSLTGAIYLPELRTFGINVFSGALSKTCVINFPKTTSGLGYYLRSNKAQHIWSINNDSINGADSTTMLTLQMDNLSSMNSGTFQNSTSVTHTLVMRKNNVVTLAGTLKGQFETGKNGIVYVPADLVESYNTTNWTVLYNEGRIIGINEDTTATVGIEFVPTTSASITRWDKVDLQSYDVGTLDTASGAITPTHDGRLLIRGFDANDNIVHCTYLQIGTGFDEEANAL